MVGKDGIEGALLVDAAGLAVAAVLPAGQDEPSAAAAVAELRRTSGPVCGELGLGGFEDASVETAGGGFHVYAIRELTLGVYSAPHSRAGLVGLHARAFAKKVQAAGTGEGAA